MQFKKGAEIISSEGEKVGTLDRVVMDPKTREVAYLVVRSGFLLTEDKLIPIDKVGPITGDRISVMASKESFDKFPMYEDVHYVPLGTDKDHPEDVDIYYWYPPAVGWDITGRYIPFPEPLYIRETEKNIPEGMIALKEGAKVITSDGKHVGNIERMITAEKNNYITHLVVSSGLFFKERKLVPAFWLTDVSDDAAHLAVESSFLDRLPEFHLESE